MTSRQILEKMTECKSYLKWSKERLCEKFSCSRKIMENILEELKPLKKEYLRSFDTTSIRVMKKTDRIKRK